MPGLSIIASLAPYHILSYGTLLGAQIHQSFISGIIAFRTLPRPQFSALQQKIFPVYFSVQTALPVLLALTYPGDSRGFSTTPSSLVGVFASENRWSVLFPILTILSTSVANLLVVLPATAKIVRERNHQETIDGKKSYDPAPHSKDMLRLNKEFGKMHGISSLLNLVTLIATVGYGFTLAERLQ